MRLHHPHQSVSSVHKKVVPKSQDKKHRFGKYGHTRNRVGQVDNITRLLVKPQDKTKMEYVKIPTIRGQVEREK